MPLEFMQLFRTVTPNATTTANIQRDFIPILLPPERLSKCFPPTLICERTDEKSMKGLPHLCIRKGQKSANW